MNAQRILLFMNLVLLFQRFSQAKIHFKAGKEIHARRSKRG